MCNYQVRGRVIERDGFQFVILGQERSYKKIYINDGKGNLRFIESATTMHDAEDYVRRYDTGTEGEVRLLN